MSVESCRILESVNGAVLADVVTPDDSYSGANLSQN
jgi:hypothetical protein